MLPITLTLASLLSVGSPVLILTWKESVSREKAEKMDECLHLTCVGPVVYKVSGDEAECSIPEVVEAVGHS